MAETPTATKPERILLWGLPRSLTTVLTKCLSHVDGIYVIHEPYAAAITAGPERDKNLPGVVDFMTKASTSDVDIGDQCWDDDICTFQWVKDTLEADYPGKKIIFCKDIVQSTTVRYDMIPRGYRHTFIIRNPIKSFLSSRKLFVEKILPPEIPSEMLQLDELMKTLKKENPYKVISALVKHLKEQGLESNPVIIDADDLQDHPASILRQYCEAVGIPYSDSLLQWEAGEDIIKKKWYVSRALQRGNLLGNYYGAAFASTKFNPSKDPPPTAEIPPDVIRGSDEAMPYYKELYDMRLKP